MWLTYVWVRAPSVAPLFFGRIMIEFKSSSNAEPSEPVAPVPYNPQVRGTTAPTVVEPADIVDHMTVQEKQEMEEVGTSPQLEKELNSLGVPDDMQKFMQVALRKPHLITVTYLSNSGRFLHHVNMNRRFPKDRVPQVFDHFKVRSAEIFLGKPDLAGHLKNQIARQRKRPPSRGGRKKKRKKGRRR